MAGETTYADWIAVDWGTTNLRAWAMRGSEAVAQVRSDKGMAALDRADFEPALVDLIEPWLGADRILIVACGMVGSRSGWIEAPYRTVPARPHGTETVRAAARDRRLDVRVIPGVKQSAPADVMRGEETQIAGFLSRKPNFDGVLCLPGTHTKWVQISAGEVVSFRTFMTGELFSLIAERSVLRHTLGPGWDDEAFHASLADTMSRPEALAQRLFAIRAEGLLDDLDGAAARSRLSGLLIGAELAASRPYWLGQDVCIIGAPDLSRIYAAALSAQGASPELADGDTATLGGLAAAARAILEETE